jgi:hypothetical protein
VAPGAASKIQGEKSYQGIETPAQSRPLERPFVQEGMRVGLSSHGAPSRRDTCAPFELTAPLWRQQEAIQPLDENHPRTFTSCGQSAVLGYPIVLVSILFAGERRCGGSRSRFSRSTRIFYVRSPRAANPRSSDMPASCFLLFSLGAEAPPAQKDVSFDGNVPDDGSRRGRTSTFIPSPAIQGAVRSVASSARASPEEPSSFFSPRTSLRDKASECNATVGFQSIRHARFASSRTMNQQAPLKTGTRPILSLARSRLASNEQRNFSLGSELGEGGAGPRTGNRRQRAGRTGLPATPARALLVAARDGRVERQPRPCASPGCPVVLVGAPLSRQRAAPSLDDPPVPRLEAA